jgi:hypothetical protein
VTADAVRIDGPSSSWCSTLSDLCQNGRRDSSRDGHTGAKRQFHDRNDTPVEAPGPGQGLPPACARPDPFDSLPT